MSAPQITEADMRAALGLAPTAPAKESKPVTTANPVDKLDKKPKRISSHTLVILSVRKPSGGPPFRFEYKSSSISTLAAQLEAEKAVRKQGLDIWALLDIQQISG